MTGARDPDWEARVRDGFAAQGLMRTFGAEIVALEPGLAVLAAPITPAVSQHHGFAHAALAFALGDNAGGFAATSLLGPGESVVTVEQKVNFLAPARGQRVVAEGRVERGGRRLSVVRAEVFAEGPEGRVAVALLLGTMAMMAAR
ncbi:MAG: PaaI family thioesterase [Paracoccaceae bacterium]